MLHFLRLCSQRLGNSEARQGELQEASLVNGKQQKSKHKLPKIITDSPRQQFLLA